MLCQECGTRLPESATKCHFCGCKTFVETEVNFVHKLTSLFTLWVVFLTVFLLFYTINSEIELFPTKIENAILGLIDGIVITGGYWLLSPKMIEIMLDPKKVKPHNIGMWLLMISLIIYSAVVFYIYTQIAAKSPILFSILSIASIIVLILVNYIFLNYSHIYG
jgi:hypothetical protein